MDKNLQFIRHDYKAEGIIKAEVPILTEQLDDGGSICSND